MKIKSVLTTALLATTALLVAGRSSQAALSYSAGDLFLGFQKTGVATDYLVNIGNVAQYSRLDGSSFTVNVGGSVGSDLSDTFGATWYQSNTLFWSVSGTTFANLGDLNTIYLTKARANISTQTSPWLSLSNNGQGDQVGLLQALGVAYRENGVATGNSTKGTFQSTTLANSYASFTQGTSTDFQWGNIEGKFSVAGEAGGSVLDLYQVTPSLTQAPATYLGKFTIDNNGIVTFTSAVPEPSTYGLLIGAGLVLLVIARRRRAAVKA